MYELLAAEGYWLERDSLSKKASLPCKLSKFTGAPASTTAARNVCAHARIASKHVAPAIWNNQLRLIMNALPFEKRRKEANMLHSLPRAHIRCYFCDREEDSAAHVYVCPVVCAARETVGERVSCKLQDGLGHTALTFPPCDSPLPTLLTFAFNWSVWRTRSDFFSTLGFHCEFQRAVNHIVSHTLCHFDPNEEGPSIAESRLVALANQPPEGVAICFTDGSRQEDGAAGAGYTIRLPNEEEECHADFLGRCDNCQQRGGDGGAPADYPAPPPTSPRRLGGPCHDLLGLCGLLGLPARRLGHQGEAGNCKGGKAALQQGKVALHP